MSTLTAICPTCGYQHDTDERGFKKLHAQWEMATGKVPAPTPPNSSPAATEGTPRTDAAASTLEPSVNPWSLCRTLERELATEKRMRRTMESAHGEMLSECVTLRQELSAARGDKEGMGNDTARLEALLAGANKSGGLRAQRYEAYYGHRHNWLDIRTREELDAAMEAKK